MKNPDVIIIGAGAAGLVAAGKSAEKGMSVLILEKMDKAGKKLLITGKGRCNITNSNPVSDHLKHIKKNARFLKYSYSMFFYNDIIEILESNGVKTINEQGNRVFPISQNAADVVNALLLWNKKQNVEFLYNCKAKNLIIENKKIRGLEIEYKNETKKISCSKIIICTGGKSYPATGSTGDGYVLAKQARHEIIQPQPALVPIETEEKIHKSLHDFTLKNVSASLWINNRKVCSEFGELCFSNFGLTGPIILKLSRQIVEHINNKEKVQVIVDLKPALDDQKLDNRLLRDIETYAKKQIKDVFKTWLPAAVIPVFLENLNLNEDMPIAQLTAKNRKKIRLLMKNWSFSICGYRSFREAIITAGGVCCKDVDSKTMQSKLIEGLYFAGEVLDIDADTGGYNLQIAWSTGWIAGSSMS
jgi:predicted Rossmann fold flavoprotein